MCAQTHTHTQTCSTTNTRRLYREGVVKKLEPAELLKIALFGQNPLYYILNYVVTKSPLQTTIASYTTACVGFDDVIFWRSEFFLMCPICGTQ